MGKNDAVLESGRKGSHLSSAALGRVEGLAIFMKKLISHSKKEMENFI